MNLRINKIAAMLPFMRPRRSICQAVILLAAFVPCSLTNAQTYHQPLSQHTPPGQAAAWLNYIRQYDPSWLQPVQVQVQGGGTLEVYSGSNQSLQMGSAPSMVAASVGHLYRFRISDMPGFPGADIYPSVELLDRLHPPAGREDEYPIPIVITSDDIQTALNGHLVTRVIYLEQPQFAQTLDPLHREIPQAIPESENALQEADRLGRPMAVIRIGGRQPSGGSPQMFFGTGGAIQLRQLPTEPSANGPASVQMNSPTMIRQVSASLQRSPARP